MYELKTKENDASVLNYISQVEEEGQKQDAMVLLDLFSEITALPAKMWGEAIVGFGRYQYKYASGHEGESCLVGFSARKGKTTLYLMLNEDPFFSPWLEKLGKHKTSKACLYIKKLSDIQLDVLKELISIAFQKAKERHAA